MIINTQNTIDNLIIENKSYIFILKAYIWTPN